MSHLASFLAQYRREAILWAKTVLADEKAIILDTETTGLDDQAEIVEIAVIDTAGRTLLDTPVKPKGRIPADASALHGLTAADVATAPIWAELDEQVHKILRGASRIVIYNAAYDTRLIRQTRKLYALPAVRIPCQRYECAMQRYAEFCGQWSDRRQSFKWQRLDGGHRALGDCLATLNALKRMAETDL
ncbi:MAG: 3'-5' exonuclease [Anaerolineae bacterium]|nr:3'-5' exonuclease [Anaerolineae bacterium]